MAVSGPTRRVPAGVIGFLRATGLKPKRTNIQSPWQNGIAERCIGSCRREILDHVIALNEQHLRRVLQDFIRYYHRDRVHCGIVKDTPNRRPVEPKPSAEAKVNFYCTAGRTAASLRLAGGRMGLFSETSFRQKPASKTPLTPCVVPDCRIDPGRALSHAPNARATALAQDGNESRRSALTDSETALNFRYPQPEENMLWVSSGR
jgi:Integrase core domain